MNYYRDDAPWHTLPEHMWDGLRDYVMEGVPVGSFMESILSGGAWTDVLSKADAENQRAIMSWCRFIYNYVPAACWGTHQRYNNWVGSGGLHGQHIVEDK